MPHATIKLTPGADQNETPVLNEAGVTSTNLIRYMYDRKLGALPQKLGGWTRFLSNMTTAIVRAIWAWEDTNGQTWLGYGTQNGPSGTAQLMVSANGNVQDITPKNTTNPNAPLDFSTTSGSNLVTITDMTITGITNYDSVYIATPVSIGGIVLSGMYPCDPNGFIGPNSYTIYATDILGNATNATSTSTTAAVPQIQTIANNQTVTVVFPNHGYSVGSTFTVLTATTVGGTVFYGQYLVASVVDLNTFTIVPSTRPTATDTEYVNGGNAYFIYSFGVGSIPAGTGYGVGAYGSGAYGSGTAVVPSVGTAVSANDWVLDNWGEVLLSCPEYPSAIPFQPIYQWDPLTGSPTATVIPQAPPINDGFFVAMPERQIIAWGSSFDGIQDPLLIRWCDISNYSVWVAQITNQAGSYRIPKGSRIVGGIQGPQQGLIWTDIGLWSMQYISQPYVYGFNEVGSGCGMIARKAAGTLGGVVYWMGPSQFFMLSGDGVAPLQCPIWDVVFQNIDQNNLQKIRVATNARFNEVAWYYPTLSSNGEVAAYIKYNTQTGAWDFGNLARSAWIDQSVLGPPIGADPNALLIYQHETSNDADGQAMTPSLQTGYFSIGDGDNMTYIDQVWPDMKWGTYGGAKNATINITFYVADYPGQTPKVFGPYAVTQSTTYISPRFRGRLVSLGISGNDTGSFWRLGAVRYRYQADGRF